MQDVCEFPALIMAQYSKSQISNFKLIKDFLERTIPDLSLRLEVSPMFRLVNISRGREKCIGILLWNLTVMKKLTQTALQVKNYGQGLGERQT